MVRHTWLLSHRNTPSAPSRQLQKRGRTQTPARSSGCCGIGCPLKVFLFVAGGDCVPVVFSFVAFVAPCCRCGLGPFRVADERQIRVVGNYCYEVSYPHMSTTHSFAKRTDPWSCLGRMGGLRVCIYNCMLANGPPCTHGRSPRSHMPPSLVMGPVHTSHWPYLTFASIEGLFEDPQGSPAREGSLASRELPQ